MLPSVFLADFFRDSTGSIFVCSLPNERNGGRPAEVCGRGDGARLDDLVNHWDRKDRGTFFCISTLRKGETRRCKENVFEIVALHADIDLKGINLPAEQVLERLGQLRYLPSKVVNSGHGFHAYWLLTEPLGADEKVASRLESVLRRLADHVGGDPAVCEVARLMRLPGSFNTKDGGRLPVQVLVDRPLRYEIDDLAEWLEESRPAIPRKGACTKTAPNPFLGVQLPVGVGGDRVDVDTRLAQMRFQGPGDSSIHATQLSVIAALLNQGVPVDQVVDRMLEETKRAAGTKGERWDWRAEEHTIRKEATAWLRKKNNSQQPPKHAIDTLENILVKDFKPVEHFIPDLIPAEGVTLLVAKSKVGKSWMLYDICISAALGRELLGGRKPKQGHSLYLALEDSQKRLRFRAEKLLGFHVGPCPGVALATTWDRVDQGGLQLIKDWVESTRAAGNTVVCVCIDVLQMIRPLGGERQSVFQRDYMAVQGLRTLAAELGVAVIIAHHQRKGAADDLQDTISGTQGLPAAVDCSIVLERQINGGFILDVRGRDIEAQQLAASFDKETCRWNVGGDASEMRRSETRRAISEALRGTAEGMSPADISAETGIKPNTVRSTLLRMVRDGEAKKVKGKYVAVTATL